MRIFSANRFVLEKTAKPFVHCAEFFLQKNNARKLECNDGFNRMTLLLDAQYTPQTSSGNSSNLCYLFFADTHFILVLGICLTK